MYLGKRNKNKLRELEWVTNSNVDTKVVREFKSGNNPALVSRLSGVAHWDCEIGTENKET